MLTIKINGAINDYSANSSGYIGYVLDNAPTEDVKVYINSLGGSFNEGLKIYTLLKRHKGKVTAYYEAGMSASAATIIGLGADERHASKHALLLVHEVSAWVDVWGQMSQSQIDEAIEYLTKRKDDLATFSEMLAGLYSDVLSIDSESIAQMMKEEKWHTAAKMQENGFIDEIYEEGKEEMPDVAAWQTLAAEAKLPSIEINIFKKKKENMNLLQTLVGFFKGNGATEAEAQRQASDLSALIASDLKASVNEAVNNVVNEAVSKLPKNDDTAILNRISQLETSFSEKVAALTNESAKSLQAANLQIENLQNELNATKKVVGEQKIKAALPKPETSGAHGADGKPTAVKSRFASLHALHAFNDETNY